ncbi:MAG TPA: ABC transporter permease [Candidatus Moranbacteria bacterium]|nr:ABC transporter permease [Candidatus Moranbacteria bacterium]
MKKQHENYQELIWRLAKTDFKLRYQGSILGYFWALLKPMLTFTVLYFVFSSIFNPRNSDGVSTYSLELLVGILMYSFFAEGTGAGLSSLMSKAQLVTKIYVPRWTIILAATINSAMIYSMNLLIIVALFAIKGFLPEWQAVALFFLFSFFIYILIVSFSFIAAPLFVKFRDLSMIWEVLLMIIMYASPIIYPLVTLPAKYHQLILLNPVAFIVHFTKESLIHAHYADPSQYLIFIIMLIAFFVSSIFIYQKMIKRVAENM